METVSWHDFTKIEIRVGKVIAAESLKKARKPAFVLHVDFGEAVGLRKSSAQISDLYEVEDLVGKLVVGVVNLKPKQIGSMMSDCLITGFHRPDGSVALCVPDKSVEPGARLM